MRKFRLDFPISIDIGSFEQVISADRPSTNRLIALDMQSWVEINAVRRSHRKLRAGLRYHTYALFRGDMTVNSAVNSAHHHFKGFASYPWRDSNSATKTAHTKAATPERPSNVSRNRANLLEYAAASKRRRSRSWVTAECTNLFTLHVVPCIFSLYHWVHETMRNKRR